MSSKIIYRGKAKIYVDDYVLKKKNNDIKYLYDYLESRNFFNYPNLLDEDNDYYKFEYMKNSREANIEEVLKIMGILHNKTFFYKEISEEKINDIYYKILENINYVFNFYEETINEIDKHEYFSPNEYLIARNISSFYQSLDKSKSYLNKWKNEVLKKKQIRLSLIHNNINNSNVLVNDSINLISFDNYREDMPILDCIKYYKNQNYDINIIRKIEVYFKEFELLEEEKYLLYSIILIPRIIRLNGEEIDKTIYNRELINNNYELLKIIV